MSTFHTGLNGDLSLGRLGKPNGFASLTAAGKIPASQIPSGVAGGLNFVGLWDASTNTPDLTTITPANGDLYIVSVEGSQNLNGEGLELFTLKDSVFWSESEGVWYHQQGTTVAEEVAYDNTSSELTATNVQLAIDEIAAGKLKLTADTTFYVDSVLGSDSNNGTLPGAGAFQTLVGALTALSASIDLDRYKLTIQLAAGTYSEGNFKLPEFTGAYSNSFGSFFPNVVILGDDTTPSNVVLEAAVHNDCKTTWYRFQGVQFNADTTAGLQGYGILAVDKSKTDLVNINFVRTGGTNFYAAIRCNTSASIAVGGTISLSGVITHFGYFQTNAYLQMDSITVDIIDTASGRSSFMRIESHSTVEMVNATYVNPLNWGGGQLAISENSRITLGIDPDDLPGTPRSWQFGYNTSSVWSILGASINGATIYDFWHSEVLASDININVGDEFRRAWNRDYTVTADRIITLPGDQLYNPYRFTLKNNPASTANISISNGVTLLATILPGEIYTIERHETDWVISKQPQNANQLDYDNTSSSLISTSVQTAIDEVDAKLDIISVDTSSTTLPITSGNESLVIGYGSSGGGVSNTIIGLNATGTGNSSTSFGRNSIAGGDATAFGAGANCPGSQSVAIGLNSQALSSSSVSIGTNASSNITSVSVGRSASCSNRDNVAVGHQSSVTGEDSVALGKDAQVTSNFAVQLAAGTNTTSNTLQFLTVRLANAQGLYTNFTTPVNYTPSDTDNVTSHFQAIDTVIGTLQTQLVGGVAYKGGYNVSADFPSLSSQVVTLSGTATLNDTVNVVGSGTFFTTEIVSGDTIIIAGESRIVDVITNDTNLTVTSAFTAGSVSGETITKDAVLIPISTGDMYTVTAAGNFFGAALAIGDVLIAEVDSPTVQTDWTIVENNIEDAADVAFNNVASGLAATNVQTAIDEVEGRVDTLESTAPAQASTVNRETITANKTLVNTDEIYQHIKSNTASLLVNLPGSPVNGTHFIVKNDATSTESFTTNSVVLSPGDIYEVIYDGVEWVVL